MALASLPTIEVYFFDSIIFEEGNPQSFLDPLLQGAIYAERQELSVRMISNYFK